MLSPQTCCKSAQPTGSYDSINSPAAGVGAPPPLSNHTPQHLHTNPSANSALAALMYPTRARHLGGRNPPNIPRECNQSAQYHLVNPRSQWLHPTDAHRASNTELVMGQPTRHLLHHITQLTAKTLQTKLHNPGASDLPAVPTKTGPGIVSVAHSALAGWGRHGGISQSHIHTALSWCTILVQAPPDAAGCQRRCTFPCNTDTARDNKNRRPRTPANGQPG